MHVAFTHLLKIKQPVVLNACSSNTLSFLELDIGGVSGGKKKKMGCQQINKQCLET